MTRQLHCAHAKKKVREGPVNTSVEFQLETREIPNTSFNLQGIE